MGIADMYSLAGKKAMVTGARAGIGQAIAVGLAEAGADLILVGHRQNMGETEGLIQKAGRKYETFIIDLSNPEQVVGKVQEILSKHKVDVLVNNAGIIRREKAVDYAKDDWDAVINTNMNSVFLLTQQVARPMLACKQGKIINIASLLSFQGGVTVPSYTASKHAVAGLTKAWANEWAAFNVNVNAIAPGYIETNVTEALRKDEARQKSILERIPAGRWGRPEDLAGTAVFLASRASDYVNGHILVVDGGWMSR